MFTKPNPRTEYVSGVVFSNRIDMTSTSSEYVEIANRQAIPHTLSITSKAGGGLHCIEQSDSQSNVLPDETPTSFHIT